MSKKRDIDKLLQQWWIKIKENPENALKEFLTEVKNQNSEAYEQGSMILKGYQNAWQIGSKSIEDAVNFLITNTLMKSNGTGVK